MLVDSHTHIYMRQYDAERDRVIQRAFESGVEALLSIGIDYHCSKVSIELADHYTGIFATVGFHPHDATALNDESFSALAELGREPKVVAVGEIGLDFYRNISPRDIQLNAFRRQLELASQLNLPVVIHNRDADKETVGILKAWVAATPEFSRPLRGVIHCFSGDLAMAHECIGLGFLISISGTITYPNARRLAEVVRRLPLDNLLVETDCPFLTPEPYRSKRNEPAYVRLVADKIAELKGVGVDDVATATTRNAVALFGLALPQ